ncbi:MAG: outer membrane protein assembly factor BamD [Bacteroidetes bacterium]|nr:outer membrane protein assembly factor BamD [Bacteroidota bacterium]
MRLTRILVPVIISLFVFTSCNKFSKVEKSKDPEYKYQKAEEYYGKKKYRNAQQLYEQLFPLMKGTDRFEELYYKWCYCYYYLGEYREAENLFKGFLEVFPNSSKAEEADYMRAFCFYKQSPKLELEQVNTIKAMAMMQTFINTHPGSARVKDATEIIDKSREKLEQKDYRTAKLYYDLGQYRASAIAFGTILNSFPESARGEEYKYMVVKSYYRFAKMSITEKQLERFEKVTEEYQDFADRYPQSKWLKDAENYSNLSQNKIKEIQNEQTSPSAKR